MKLKLLILFAVMISYSDKNPELQSIRVEKGCVYNQELSFVHAPEGWIGNKVNSRNEFINIDQVTMPSFGDVLKWKLKKNPQEKEKKSENFKLEIVRDTTFLSSSENVVVWLGHSTFYIRLDGISFITDPVFYDIPFVKRHHELPFDPSLIKDLDYILISHNHRDHCDKKSLRLLSENNPKAMVLAGLEMEKLMSKWISNKIQEAGWFQKYNTSHNIKIVFLPTQHWSKRGLSDNNKELWGSFSVKVGEKSIYFGGDTGWGSHFSYIGKNFGPFDVCFLPIGAYSPRWFMKSSHIDPSEAIEGFKLLNAKSLIPMHYGTYDLSDEPMGEPINLLNDQFRIKENDRKLWCLSVGKAINF